ncbi:uncharacterized protein with LGFP repeats [Kibdelosporangium banguiense]|uniref:Uncharacterized protein with LGFP repeats n=1 Tax=Kibdelosporangium banguiense TaxID=1365924 RepID=A0ABS4T8R5_9PSEU|nr:N-acetylmuramoyl-L-alanine amidase [Kibdelosporangium banguiense]MBP2320807.1 uncharacterized protein with LGFP repeats [Kibdelosporangium banguiense]
MRSLAVLTLTAVLSAGLFAPVANAQSARTGIETVALESTAAKRSAGVNEINDRRFAMVALAGTAKLPEGVEIQVKRLGGDWGAWEPLDTDDAIDNKTEPLWVGHSTAIRVRGAEQAGLALKLIDPGVKATDSPRQRAALAAAAGRPVIAGRAAWGADESVRTACFARQGIGIEYASTIKAATIHHTAGTNDYTAADSAAIMRGIYLFHAIDRDWCDIGYNFLVDKFGQIFEGRIGGLESPVWGAHAGGFNQFTFGVSMMGNFETDIEPSGPQIDAVASVVAWKFANGYRDPNGTVTLISGGGGTSKYPAGTPVTLPVIFAHRDVGNTECPGQKAYDLMPTIRQKVTERMGVWTASPIYQKWQAAGADAGPLQGPFRVEQDSGRGGRWATFAGDSKSVYWSAGTGARIIEGAIRDRWAQLGFEFGVFGFPTTDELTTPDTLGRYNDFEFQDGSIYWSNATGAHSVQGAIKQRWAALNKEAGPLGYPISDELGATNGRYNDFQKESASIYWSNATGAHSVQGAIKSKWNEFGRENSFLGYPTTDELVGANGGRYNDFAGEGGSIYWSNATGAHSLQGAIKGKWVELNKEAGVLGYPTTDETVTPNKLGRYNHFAGQGGSIYWSNATGAHSVQGLIKQRWAALGWETSYLGFPTSDEHPAPGGLRSDFQGGYIFYSFATGQATDHRYP